MEPAEFAMAKVVEDKPNSHIDIVAYYGEGETTDKHGITHKDGVVSIKTLGRLLTKYGDNDTLIVTTVNNKIKAATVEDYMSGKYEFKQQYLKK